MSSKIISGEANVSDSKFLGSWVESGLECSETVVLEHVQEGLPSAAFPVCKRADVEDKAVGLDVADRVCSRTIACDFGSSGNAPHDDATAALPVVPLLFEEFYTHRLSSIVQTEEQELRICISASVFGFPSLPPKRTLVHQPCQVSIVIIPTHQAGQGHPKTSSTLSATPPHSHAAHAQG